MFLLVISLVFASYETATASFFTPNHIPDFPFTISNSPYPSCFTEKTTWSNQEANNFITGVPDLYSCQALCLSSNTCHHFTWFNSKATLFDLGCFLYDKPTVEYPCSNCVSGPESCTCSDHFSCQFTPDNFVGDVPHVETEIMCQDYCAKTDQCTFYSWFEADPFPNLCLMFSRCEERYLNCKSCHSGPADCENTAIITSTSHPETSPPVTSSTYSSPTYTSLSTTPVGPYLSCFDKDFTWPSHFISSIIPDVYTPISCQENCQENGDSCTDFTWYSPDASPLQNACLLFLNPSTPISCDHCVNGPSSCLCSANYACKVNNNLVDVIAPMDDELLCQEECFQSPLCTFYTYFDIDSHPFDQTCYLFSSCDNVDFSCSGCSSGPDDCRNTNHISTSHPTSPPNPTTIPTSPFISTTTHPYYCPELAPQKHGDWFCPPSIIPATCHLECHPGYASTNSTVILCEGGVWTEEPSCVPAVALITGGRSSKNTVEVYAEGLHQKMPDLPDNRFKHSLQLVNSVVLLCGGEYTITSCLTLTASHEWESHSTTGSERYKHASISMMGHLYLLGGYAYSSGSTTEFLAPPSHQWSDGWPLLESNYEACAAKMDPEVFMLTGGGGSYQQNTVVSYNVTSGTAKRLQDLINPYAFHGCAAVRDAETGFRAVIVAGGMLGGKDQSEMYDIKTGEWSVTGKLTTRRDDVRLVVLGQNILALGGDGLASVDKFNITARTWSPTEEMLEIRNYHGVAAVPPSLVRIGQN